MFNKQVIIVDAYGVFKFGYGLSYSAVGRMKEWINQGKMVFILSNTTALNDSTEKGYAKKGLVRGIHFTDILTSGQFAAEDISKGSLPFAGKKFYVFGTANFKNPDPTPAIFSLNPDYTAVPTVDEADFVYCGIPQIDGADQVEVDVFVPLLQELVKHGKPMLCINPDRQANEGGRFVVRQGRIADLYEAMGGTVVRYGKPDPRIFEALVARCCPEVAKKDMVMIGDTVYTDVRGAHRFGIDAVLLLEDGVSECDMKKENVGIEKFFKGLPPEDVPDNILISL